MSGALQTRGWDHTSLAVTDLDAAIEFYGRAFGYRVTWEERDWTDLMERYLGQAGVRADLVQMRMPGNTHTLELIAFYGLGQPADPGPTRAGMGHPCFRVDDVELAVAQARELGAELLGEITPYPVGGRGCYMRDPAGSFFELDEAPMNI